MGVFPTFVTVTVTLNSPKGPSINDSVINNFFLIPSPKYKLAASFKNTEQVHALISAGIDAVTLPPDIVYTMMDHPGTKFAVDEFSAAWHEAYGRDTLI